MHRYNVYGWLEYSIGVNLVVFVSLVIAVYNCKETL